MKGFSASELNALYYVAFKDWEEEEKRKEEEKKKKDKEKKQLQNEERMLQALQASGQRLPAKALQDLARRKKELREKQNTDDTVGNLSSLHMEDLIDELEG